MPTRHSQLPLEIKTDIMRQLDMRSRQAYAGVFPELTSAYLEDLAAAEAEALERFARLVFESQVALRITLGMKAWSVSRDMGRAHEQLYAVCDLAGQGGSSFVDPDSMLAYFKPAVSESVSAVGPLRVVPFWQCDGKQ